MCFLCASVCVCVGGRGGRDYSQMDFHFSLMKHEASVTANDALAAHHSHEYMEFRPLSSSSWFFRLLTYQPVSILALFFLYIIPFSSIFHSVMHFSPLHLPFFKSVVVCLVSHPFLPLSFFPAICSQKQAVLLQAGAVVPVLRGVSDPECQMDIPGQES